MYKSLSLLVIGLMFVLLVHDKANARELTVDLTSPIVQITAGFAGTNMLLYGVTPQEGDIVVVVRGPQENIVVRRQDRTFGIWINKEQLEFKDIPSFYAIASNLALDEFLPSDIAAIYQIGVDNLVLESINPTSEEKIQGHFRHALIRNKQRQGLYNPESQPLLFLGNGMFRTKLNFPANVTVGTYSIDVHLIRQGELVTSETTLLNVRKFGIEAKIFEFAHRFSFYYGIIAVLIACIAGWAANAIFRKS